MQLQRSHYALELAKSIGSNVLFPINLVYQKPILKVNMESIVWLNKNLNKYQKQAVFQILKSEARPTPYVIFGPPGTGKTVTIIESILQIYTLDTKSRIIVCSVSNNSADLIAHKLFASGQILKNDLVRFIAHSRGTAIPLDLESNLMD